MLKKILAISLFILSLCFNTYAAGNYEWCNDILAHGITNDSYYQNSEEVHQIMEDWLCWSASGKAEVNVELQLGVLDYLIGGGGGDVKKWAEEHCSESYDSYDIQSISIAMSQYVDDGVLEAWTQCVTANPDGLLCYVEQNNKNSVFVAAAIPHRIRDISLMLDNLELDGSVPRYIEGKYTFKFDKIDPDSSATFSLNGLLSGDYLSCTVSVPLPDFELPKFALYEDNNEATSDFKLTPEWENLKPGYSRGPNIIGYANKESKPGYNIPIYEYYNTYWNEYAYREYANLEMFAFVRSEKPIFYAFKEGGPGRIAIYEYINSVTHDFLYRTFADLEGFAYVRSDKPIFYLLQ